MRQYVRDVLEVEAEDWPDPLVDAALKEGYDRIVARENRWPFLAGRWSFTVVSGVPEYQLSELGSVRDITSIMLGSHRLQFISEDEAELRYGVDSSGRPAAFSRWGDSIRFWPKPAGDYDVTLRGYREPEPFQSLAGWVPDLPDEFHSLLCDWALGNEYQRQDDSEMMETYRNKFEQQLSTLRNQTLAVPTPTPLVFGGAGLRNGY